MGFFKTLKSSIYDPEFYEKIKYQSLGQAIKYFFLLILFLTLINTLLLSYDLGFKAPEEVKKFVNQTVNSFPSNLEVSVEDGQVSTNASEPFFVPFPQPDSEYNNLNNVLVIDTKTPYSATQFDQYKTLFWLTKDSLFYQNDDFDQRSLDLSEFDNIKVDKNFVQDLVSKINPWLNLIGPFLILMVFIGMFISFIFNLVYFFFLALLIFFLAGIFKWGLNYKASYKTAIYSSTAAFLIDLILFNTGGFTGFFGFPFLFTLTALCVTTVNLQNFDKSA